jgi:hypothetical protein
MGFELERVLYETEDFLRRAIGSPGLRAAKKRRMQRKMEEFGRRAKRSGILVAVLLVLLFAYAIYAPLSLILWAVALPLILLIGGLLMFQPTRHARRNETEGRATPDTLPLSDLVVRAEEALLDRCDELPGRALPAADRIMARLRDLQPHLHQLRPDAPLAGDIRRLVGQHLPQLIDSYLALPPATRAAGSESSRRVTESLDIVAGELDHLLTLGSHERQSDFDTQSRFIESRYKEDDRLRGGR